MHRLAAALVLALCAATSPTLVQAQVTVSDDEIDLCQRAGCDMLTQVGNGVCDLVCNNDFCLNDRGDCDAPPGPTVPSNGANTDPSGYNIDLVYLNPVEDERILRAFASAQQRWSQVIIGDLTDSRVPETLPNCPDMGLTPGSIMDDLMISVDIVEIDGPGNTLVQGAPCATDTNGFPRFGLMRFDVADLNGAMANGTLEGVILHEMGHVIGIGSIGAWSSNVIDTPNDGPVYTGANAIRELASITGLRGIRPDVEDTGGPGTARVHWRESTYGTELMTGFVDPVMQLSALTIGSLEDIGYTVSVSSADAFTLPTAQSFNTENRQVFGADILAISVTEFDAMGVVIAEIGPNGERTPTGNVPFNTGGVVLENVPPPGDGKSGGVLSDPVTFGALIVGAGGLVTVGAAFVVKRRSGRRETPAVQAPMHDGVSQVGAHMDRNAIEL